MKAVVQLIDPTDANDGTAAELLDWTRAWIAHYKCPRSISFEAHLPRSETGKLFNRGLVNRYSVAATGE